MILSDIDLLYFFHQTIPEVEPNPSDSICHAWSRDKRMMSSSLARFSISTIEHEFEFPNKKRHPEGVAIQDKVGWYNLVVQVRY